ncbi:MAG: class I SAM-dependent methyltransferase [Candidatus Hodarchaeota archaeon]
MVWVLILQIVLIGFLIFLFLVCVVVRIIRHYYKFPIPSFLTQVIDNPVRRRLFQTPSVIASRMYLEPGMVVVEIGPGKGSYTKAIAQAVGPGGKVYAVDIQESVIEKLKHRIKKEGIPNIIPQVGNAYAFSFPQASIDRVFALACLPEIPEPVKVLLEVHRILKPNGLISLAEFAPDPDYPLRRTVKMWASETGFTLRSEYGNWFAYQLNFAKLKGCSGKKT